MEGLIPGLLRTSLRESGLTARQLAARTGISEGRISDYLSGRHTPGSAQLQRMLAATGHGLRVVRDLDANGLILPELLDLSDAVAVDRGRPGRAEKLPLFRELVAPGD